MTLPGAAKARLHRGLRGPCKAFSKSTGCCRLVPFHRRLEEWAPHHEELHALPGGPHLGGVQDVPELQRRCLEELPHPQVARQHAEPAHRLTRGLRAEERRSVAKSHTRAARRSPKHLGCLGKKARETVLGPSVPGLAPHLQVAGADLFLDESSLQSLYICK